MEIKNGGLGIGSDLVVRVRCLENEEELVVSQGEVRILLICSISRFFRLLSALNSETGVNSGCQLSRNSKPMSWIVAANDSVSTAFV